MIGSRMRLYCCLTALLAVLAVGAVAGAAQDATQLDASKKLEEMPVLNGQEWQTMEQDAKLAFIWGIGHVVTVEEHVVKRHPELQRNGFVEKLGDGLRGIPMGEIVQRIDNFYKSNPDDLDLPVMRVIWGQIVKPRLKSGVSGQPLSKED